MIVQYFLIAKLSILNSIVVTNGANCFGTINFQPYSFPFDINAYSWSDACDHFALHCLVVIFVVSELNFYFMGDQFEVNSYKSQF